MEKSNRFVTHLVTGLAVLLAVNAAQAQFIRGAGGGEGQISASGHIHLQRSPTHLRMYLQLTGKGKTLEEALAALKERRERVTTQLEKLGVEKSVLVFTPPGVDDSLNARQRQMEAMIAQRLGPRAKKGAKAAKPPVAVTTMLTAQWPLTGDTTEKLLLASDAVREKIKAAGISGGKEAEKLSPEEQEVAEEMAAQNANMGNEEEQMKPGEAHFLFVARLAPQDRQTALADAFAKAKQQAGELAKAAGAGLGPMTGLSGDGGGTMSSAGMGYQRYNNYNRGEYDQFLQQVTQTAATEEQANEAMAPRPDGIGFDFNVSATFAVEAKK